MVESSVVFTVGHSTRSAEELVELLTSHDTDLLVDVRRHPGSRRHPHFDREALAATLDEAGIGYRHGEELGGRRSLEEAPEDGPCAGVAVRGLPGQRPSPDRRAGPPGRSFRTPSWSERFLDSPANVGTPGLDPETAWSGDVGLELSPTDGVRLGVTGFLSKRALRPLSEKLRLEVRRDLGRGLSADVR